ncbi:Alanine--tRNA ligase [Metarhizium acridum]|nr:Alanine--tRNA ligase [Metarhizium acridum]
MWNIVFMQFDRQKDQSLKPLPSKHIDTGMGFERLVSALQNKMSNYATDIFTPLFAKIQEVTGAREYTDEYGNQDIDGISTAYRVVADHLRLLTFAISDGALPNNEGRGYVVRRVLRRGSRYARKYLNAEVGCFFSKLLPTLVEQMGEQFPDLVKKQKDIKDVLDEEEQAFAKTLSRGERQFEKYSAQASATGSKKLSGANVWRLSDTYGFPEDLTKLMAEERGLSIDENEVADARQKARQDSMVIKNSVQTFAKLNIHQLAKLKETLQLPPSDDESKFSKGNITARVQLIFTGSEFLESTKGIPPNEPFGLFLDRTNFYAEQGGQVTDTGRIIIGVDVAEFKVLDVQQLGGYIVHNGYLEYGELKAGDEVVSEYDELRRQLIRNNHTGTHILNHSIREVLGDIDQHGSLVDQDRLRFDFSHKATITISDLKVIEDMSNAYIRRDCKVYAKVVELELALRINGIRAVFGEKYINPVRVVSVGIDVDKILEKPENPQWRNFSIELCGGTHVAKTGIIKEMVIVEENGIASGIRRVVAYTGNAAYAAQRDAAEFAKRIDEIDALPFGAEKEAAVKAAARDRENLIISKVTAEGLEAKFTKVVKSVTDEQKKRQKAESKAAFDAVTGHFAKVENKGAKFFIGYLPISANAKVIFDVINHYKTNEKEKSVYLFGGSTAEGAVVHGVYVAKDLALKGVTAEAWAAAVSKVVGGKSGGKEPTRQGRGTNAEKIDDAVEAARNWLEQKLRL